MAKYECKEREIELAQNGGPSTMKELLINFHTVEMCKHNW